MGLRVLADANTIFLIKIVNLVLTKPMIGCYNAYVSYKCLSHFCYLQEGKISNRHRGLLTAVKMGVRHLRWSLEAPCLRISGVYSLLLYGFLMKCGKKTNSLSSYTFIFIIKTEDSRSMGLNAPGIFCFPGEEPVQRSVQNES